MDIFTLIEQGSYIGKTNNSTADIFRLDNELWSVSRLTGECRKIDTEFEQHYLQPSGSEVRGF